MQSLNLKFHGLFLSSRQSRGPLNSRGPLRSSLTLTTARPRPLPQLFELLPKETHFARQKKIFLSKYVAQELIPGEVCGGLIFIGERDPAHQPIISIECHAETVLVEDVEGMFLNPVDRSGVHIAGETNFQWNAFIQHILRERSHAENLRVLDLHVLNQTRCVADAVRAAPLDSLPYGFLAEGFARVNRNIEVFALDVVKRIDVFLRRVSALFTRQIESDNSRRLWYHRRCFEYSYQR